MFTVAGVQNQFICMCQRQRDRRRSHLIYGDAVLDASTSATYVDESSGGYVVVEHCWRAASLTVLQYFSKRQLCFTIASRPLIWMRLLSNQAHVNKHRGQWLKKFSLQSHSNCSSHSSIRLVSWMRIICDLKNLITVWRSSFGQKYCEGFHIGLKCYHKQARLKELIPDCTSLALS